MAPMAEMLRPVGGVRDISDRSPEQIIQAVDHQARTG